MVRGSVPYAYGASRQGNALPKTHVHVTNQRKLLECILRATRNCEGCVIRNHCVSPLRAGTQPRATDPAARCRNRGTGTLSVRMAGTVVHAHFVDDATHIPTNSQRIHPTTPAHPRSVRAPAALAALRSPTPTRPQPTMPACAEGTRPDRTMSAAGAGRMQGSALASCAPSLSQGPQKRTQQVTDSH